jgi:hypothetical protein
MRPHGFTESILQAHGFTTEFLDGLVRNGFETAEPNSMHAPRRARATPVVSIAAERATIKLVALHRP